LQLSNTPGETLLRQTTLSRRFFQIFLAR